MLHQESKAKVFELLQAMGFDKAVVHFSGGNDEGSIDGIQLVKNSTGDIPEYSRELESDHWDILCEGGAYTGVEKSYWHNPTPPSPITDDMFLASFLVVPVYDKYSGFAGDFSVNGTVEWTVSSKTVYLQASESVETWEDHEDFVE